MRRSSHAILFVGFVTAGLAVVFGGCSSTAVPGEGACTYGGFSRAAGASFPSTDGCNTCTCKAGAVACTEKACVGPASCSYGGVTHTQGASFPSTDGCNTCSCGAGGVVACTLVGCPVDGGGDGSLDAALSVDGGACTYGGTLHAVGTTFPATDGCNTCSCGDGGVVGCTKKLCLEAGATDAAYTCPPDGTINCMPIVPPANVPLCSGPQNAWIVANCPGVKFVY